VRFLTLLRAAWALNAVTLLARLGTDLGTHALDYATLGVFFRFQIPDFDLFFGFFSLCHLNFSFYLFWVVLGQQPPLIPARLWWAVIF
jgi:hypothetical protein